MLSCLTNEVKKWMLINFSTKITRFMHLNRLLSPCSTAYTNSATHFSTFLIPHTNFTFKLRLSFIFKSRVVPK